MSEIVAGSGQPSGQPNALPIREAVSEQQIQSVLNICHALQPYILVPAREMEDGVPKQLEGGIVASAAATFINACNCLDTMLADKARWNLAGHDALLRTILATYNQQREFLAAQTKSAQIVQRPAWQLKPRLVLMGGEYVAIWGDTAMPENCILGRGATPEAAFEDFDAAFKRKAAEQLFLEPDPTPEPEPEQKKTRKPKKNNPE